MYLYTFVSYVIYAEFIKALLVPMYSDKGTQECRLEEVTYMHFVDFLDECEG